MVFVQKYQFITELQICSSGNITEIDNRKLRHLNSYGSVWLNLCINEWYTDISIALFCAILAKHLSAQTGTEII